MDTSKITKTQAKYGRYSAIVRSGNNKEAKAAEKKGRSESKKRGRDLHGGLEVLDLNFLLDIVENADGTDEYDMTMCKLGFRELARTGRLGDIDSGALGYVCMDKDGLFDKRMQCEAMQELAARTEQRTSDELRDSELPRLRVLNEKKLRNLAEMAKRLSK